MSIAPIICVIYLRLSDLRDEPNFDKRIAVLRDFANRLGWTVLGDPVIENDMMGGKDGKLRGASAFKRRKVRLPDGQLALRVIRPGFRKVLGLLASGHVQALLVEDLDRVVRDYRDALDLLDVCELTGASARSLSESLTITSGGTERERDDIMRLVDHARKSSLDTQRRVVAGRQRNWGDSYQGGPRQYGYERAHDTEKYHRTLIVVPDEEEVIKRAAEDILDRGLSLKAVVRRLREEGVPTAQGAEWSCQTLKQVLTKPAVAGKAVYMGKTKPAPWRAILEEDVWERLRERLNQNGQAGHSTEPRYLLSGIALCGVCGDGTTLKVNWSGSRADQKGYRCSRAAHMHRNLEKVDGLVESRMITYLDDHARGEYKPPERKGIDVPALRREAADLRKREATQLRLHGMGKVSDEGLEASLDRINADLAMIQAQIHAATDEPDPVPEFRGPQPAGIVWQSLPIERKRALIRLLMDVTLMPTTKRGRGVFDADSVVTCPKHPAADSLRDA